MATNNGKKPATIADVAHINKDVLTWALNRHPQSREIVAKAIKVSPDVLVSWEAGTPVPTAKAEKLAVILRLPFGFFYLSEPPKFALPLPDARRLQPGCSPSPNFLELLTDTLVRQDWYREYLADSNEEALPFVGRFTIAANVDKVAKDVRDVLGIDASLRRSVNSWESYVKALISRVESHGIVVMRSGFVGNNARRPVTREEVQGLALSDPLAPFVFINASDFISAQVFTLAHELAHVWIGNSAIDTPDEGDSAINAIEEFCNSVATEILTPAKEFAPVWRIPHSDRVQNAAEKFWVSSFVVIRRARELGLISFDEAASLREIALSRITGKLKTTGKPSFYQMTVSRVGHRFADAVVSDFLSGRLVLTHASRLLGMKPYTAAKFFGSTVPT